MKKLYSQFRIVLMTFTLGLASVFVLNGSLKYSDEIPVDLLETQSDSVILITPKNEVCFSGGGGSHWSPSQQYVEEWKRTCLKDK